MKTKACIAGTKFAAFMLVLVLAPALAHAAGAVVDCSGGTPGAFTSINAALASLPAAGPNSISVVGTCNESVHIFNRTDLVIFGNPSATVTPPLATQRSLIIVSSQRITITNITFSGGRGVSISEQSRVDLGYVTIQNSSVAGLTSIESTVHIANGTIKNNVRSGVTVSGGAFYVESDAIGTTITANGRNGISAATAHLIISGGDGTPGLENVISNNAAVGVQVVNGAEADIDGDNRINGNHGEFGMLVIHNSTMQMSGGSISSNDGIGVHCGETSHCEWSQATKIDSNGGDGIDITDHSDAYIDGGIDISGNTGDGVLVDLSSVLNSVGGNTISNNTANGIDITALSATKFAAADTISGNATNIFCDGSSIVVGDLSAYTKVSCFNKLAKKK